jgi:hypothetical protein
MDHVLYERDNVYAVIAFEIVVDAVNETMGELVSPKVV